MAITQFISMATARASNALFGGYRGPYSHALGAGSNAARGVRVTDIVEDQRPFRELYNPGHPDANEKGIVRLPNIDPIVEMVNMMSASRSYESNITAINITKRMAEKALDIGS